MIRFICLVLLLLSFGCEIATEDGENMALPNSRDFTAVDGGALPHTTVNGLQDGVVNSWAKRHGEVELYLGAPHFRAGDIGTPVFATPGSDISWELNADNEGVYGQLPLEVGSRIVELELYWNQSGTGTLSANLFSTDFISGGALNVYDNKFGTTTAGNQSLAWTSADPSFPLTITAGLAYHFTAQFRAGVGGTGTINFYGARIRYDRP